jgi:ketosteroid isomerase-like protein
MSADRDVRDHSALVRALFAEVEAGADFRDVLRYFTADAVFDSSPMGMERASGLEAIRAMWETWSGAFEDWHIRPEDVRELARGVVLVTSYQSARPLGSSGEVEMRQWWVLEFAGDRVSSTSLFPTLEEARAAAERLARGG